MRSGFTKKQKTISIYFHEYSNMIEVQIHDTKLKKLLTAFEKNPQCYHQTDDGKHGSLTFEIEKVRLSRIVRNGNRSQRVSEKNGIQTM